MIYWCEKAWLPEGVVAGVLVRVGDNGRIVEVSISDEPPLGASVTTL